MRIEDLARRAGAELRLAAEHDADPAAMIRDLRRTRNRRRAGLAVACTAAAVAAVVALVSAPWGERRAAPVPAATRTATLPPMGEVLVFQQQAVEPDAQPKMLVGGGTLPHLPPPRPGGYWGLAFSPNGRLVAYSDAGQVEVMDLATGATRRLEVCSDCTVAWTPNSREVVTAQLTPSRALHRITVSTGATRPVSLPRNWSAATIDVNSGGRVVMAGTVGEQQALLAMDLSGDRLQVLQQGGRIYDPRWSPDGTSIAFIHKEGSLTELVQARLEVRTVHTDGSGLRTLATLAECHCHRALPHLDWSPRGRLAVVSVSTGTLTSLHEVAPDGTVNAPFGGGAGPIAWRPAG
jgi:Tol biopolymer transport system component